MSRPARGNGGAEPGETPGPAQEPPAADSEASFEVDEYEYEDSSEGDGGSEGEGESTSEEETGASDGGDAPAAQDMLYRVLFGEQR